ncbi:AzlD domain-containing protein [Bacillus sp. FSL K6-3431]|uniref:AzlD domain-containing protein n=1 Tax=Bacillus sp. FSL K6-3431 TaxID=2921500 RepID=UPI0030F6EA25
MNVSMSMVWLVLGCTIVTLIPRIIPFVFVKKVQLPDAVLKWLSFIPVCILTALVVENILLKTEQSLSIDWPVVIALIPTLIVALWTKSLSLTVIVGVACMASIRFIT